MSEGHGPPGSQRSLVHLPEVWDFVGQFLQQIGQSADVGRQVRATLEVIRNTVRADLVFVYNGTTTQVSDWSGPEKVDLPACAALGGVLLPDSSAAEGQFLRDAPTIPGLELTPGPAALLRLSRSRGVWMVALRGPGSVPFTPSELKLMSVAWRLLLQQQQAQQTHHQLKEMLFSLVRCLTAALDARDPYTWGHSERVARIAVRLSEQMGLPEAVRSELYLGGLLHDLGKVGVPDEVLRKADRLTEAEFEQVKQHTVIGDGILGHVKKLLHLRPLIRNHHEQYDGSGYPDSLVGEDIPLGARIVAVADSFDAMMSNRPYRKAMAPDMVESILRDGAGRQWDPQVVDAFFACKQEVFPICQRGLGDSVVRAVEDALQAAEAAAKANLTSFTLRPSERG